MTLIGYETDVSAVEQARDLLRLAGAANVIVEVQDFLTVAGADAMIPSRRAMFCSRR